MFLFVLGPATVSATVTELTITPHDPEIGDLIIMKGTASPGEIIKPAIILNIATDAAKGNNKYNFPINGIEVPTKKNTFTIRAEHVKNLNVKVEKWGLSWTKTAVATNGVATISQGNVPDWTYNIKIFGTAESGVTSVPLTVTAKTTSSEIVADDDGKYEYEYSTSKLLPGTYTLTIGGISKEITLSSKKERSEKINKPQGTPPVSDSKKDKEDEPVIQKIWRIFKFWK